MMAGGRLQGSPGARLVDIAPEDVLEYDQIHAEMTARITRVMRSRGHPNTQDMPVASFDLTRELRHKAEAFHLASTPRPPSQQTLKNSLNLSLAERPMGVPTTHGANGSAAQRAPAGGRKVLRPKSAPAPRRVRPPLKEDSEEIDGMAWLERHMGLLESAGEAQSFPPPDRSMQDPGSAQRPAGWSVTPSSVSPPSRDPTQFPLSSSARTLLDRSASGGRDADGFALYLPDNPASAQTNSNLFNSNQLNSNQFKSAPPPSGTAYGAPSPVLAAGGAGRTGSAGQIGRSLADAVKNRRKDKSLLAVLEALRVSPGGVLDPAVGKALSYMATLEPLPEKPKTQNPKT
ncbi:hypothetical protein T484DRAFT_3475684 [Baffinella frigidus]|nr:hypothetical protein T484DRAFT_3475684 [Cryptophyta sp. CCMP2293]